MTIQNWPGWAAGTRVSRRVQARFQMVALDDDRAGNLAVGQPLSGGADIDQSRAASEFHRGGLRRQPGKPGPSVSEQLVHAGEYAHRALPSSRSGFRILCRNVSTGAKAPRWSTS